MKPKVVVVIPYRLEDRELAEKAKKIHEVRAGIPVRVVIVPDLLGEGWVALQNFMFHLSDEPYYVYSCADYFPGKGYLKIAMEAMKRYNKKLAIFNDGKWRGHLATAALVDKTLIGGEYGTDLFFNGYFANYADPELTDYAMYKHEVVYNADAVLMEVDYDKETKPHLNQKDRAIYNSREVPWPKQFL